MSPEQLIAAERQRQQYEWGDYWRKGIDPYLKLAVLTEECGEVARELMEVGETEHLRTELAQVAAVCYAWLESVEEL